MNLEKLNTHFLSLSPEARLSEIGNHFSRVLFTSSFGTTAVYLIHLLSKTRPQQPIYFLDTTYHFPETLEYKQKLTDLFKLTVIDLKGEASRAKFTASDSTWLKDPDLCCSINKVEPLDVIKSEHDVWVSGLMKSQTEHRASLSLFVEKNDLVKFHPLIDVTEKEAESYIQANNLPEHPLKAKGFHSVGCTHCTTGGKAREGRWTNKGKTECGLHL